MNCIYDFDKTIYDGDSTIDFVIYCFKENKKSLLILPYFLISVFFYLIKIYKKEQMKSALFKVITYFENVDKLVENFWKINDKKIKKFYLENKKDNDIIISASPEFLIFPIASKVGFKLIGTKVDLETGKIIGKNCHGSEKVKRLNEIGIKSCDEFYSDSKSDTPMAMIADKAYIVNGEKIYSWELNK